MQAYAQWEEPAALVDRARLPVRGYLVETTSGTFAPTTDRAEATHTHSLDPETGDIVVEAIGAASGVRTAYHPVTGSLTLYGY